MTIVVFYLLGIVVVLMIFQLRYRLRTNQSPQVLPSGRRAKPGESSDTAKSLPVAAPGADSETRVNRYGQAA